MLKLLNRNVASEQGAKSSFGVCESYGVKLLSRASTQAHSGCAHCLRNGVFQNWQAVTCRALAHWGKMQFETGPAQLSLSESASSIAPPPHPWKQLSGSHRALYFCVMCHPEQAGWSKRDAAGWAAGGTAAHPGQPGLCMPLCFMSCLPFPWPCTGRHTPHCPRPGR